MARLDSVLTSLLTRKTLHERHPQEPAFAIDPLLKVHIAIQFSGDFEHLLTSGFEASEVTGNIAFGATDLPTIEKLDKIPTVISIESRPQNRVQLSDSIPDIGANSVWSRSNSAFSGYTGKDVIIGIIDTGIDFRHKNFINPDGTTRIIKIWDQTINAPLNPPQGGETIPAAIGSGPFAANLGYGVVYDGAQINDTLSNASPTIAVRHKDEDGHGTHVAGIAGGNGKQAGGCHGEYHYIGVAPSALFVIVRMWGLTKGDRGENQTPPANPPLGAPAGSDPVADALRFIFNEALNHSKPVVINCSFGAFNEFMDGSDSTSQDINTLLNNNSTGKSVVFAAGNDGDADFHATGSVPASGSPPLELRFKIYGSDTETRRISITYTGTNLEPQVISPVGGNPGTVTWVTIAASPGSSTTANGTGGSVSVSNNANKIVITITPPTGGNNEANTASADWKIQLRNTIATPTDIHAFCTGGSSHDWKSPKFLNNTTTNTTLTMQATGQECVTVGSYSVGGQLAASSGRGPTLSTPPGTKPEISAPGVDITSTGIATDRAGDCANCCCECCQDWYVGKGGTSMAAPHVAGVIALMLHKDPTLTHTLIKTLLTANFNTRPGDAPPADLVGWGAGKVSAQKVVTATTQVNPPVAMVAATAALNPSLLRTFLNTEYGSLYYQLANKYFREIFDLINTNKRVATAWHRSRGPVWTRFALNAFYDPEYKIPLTTGGLHFKQCIDEFALMLKRYASPEMLVDIERCEPHVRLVRDDMTLSDLMHVLGNQPLTVKEKVYLEY